MTYGWRARIGFITPSNTLETPAYEFYLMAPEGVVLVGACMSINELTAEAVEAALQLVEKTGKSVAGYAVDYLVVGGGPLAYLKGPGGDRALGRRVSAASGVPAISEMTATVEALRNFGARRIAVATPFGPKLNEPLARFLAAEGFDVASLKGLEKNSNAEITLLPIRASYQVARDAWREAQDVDAIYISCPRWPVAPNIEALEHDLGVPVVASVQSWLWAALGYLQIATPIPKYGRLLREIRPARSSESPPRPEAVPA